VQKPGGRYLRSMTSCYKNGASSSLSEKSLSLLLDFLKRKLTFVFAAINCPRHACGWCGAVAVKVQKVQNSAAEDCRFKGHLSDTDPILLYGYLAHAVQHGVKNCESVCFGVTSVFFGVS